MIIYRTLLNCVCISVRLSHIVPRPARSCDVLRVPGPPHDRAAVGVVPGSGVALNCDEVAVFKLKDKNYSDTVISAINERIDLKKKTFTSINSSEYNKLQNPILINSQVFKELVNQTAFAASNDESRPPLTGLNFKIVGDILECNCTDSYRLARKVLKLAKSIENDYNIVIPSKNIVEFSRLLTDDDKDIELHIFNNKILFKYDNILFQSRLINGNFPNTANLLPKESFLKLTVNVDNLYDVIDRVSILTSDKEKNVVTLETSGNTLTMKSSSAEIGRVEENMQIKKDKEEELRYELKKASHHSTCLVEDIEAELVTGSWSYGRYPQADACSLIQEGEFSLVEVICHVQQEEKAYHHKNKITG